ncbi:hypothetical protein ACFYOT_19670 [Saccharothrix saharensis]|uniref:hypothetical protein n=1 Tax=Saccharothrix saharensis TaxID=571190 RepID=UPI003696ED6A
MDWVVLVTLAQPVAAPDAPHTRPSLGPAAARNLAITKSVLRIQVLSSRRLLEVLPRIEAKGGAFRVDGRLSHEVGDGRVTSVHTGSGPAVIPAEPGELPLLRGFAAPADRFARREYESGDVVVAAGALSDEAFLRLTIEALLEHRVGPLGSCRATRSRSARVAAAPSSRCAPARMTSASSACTEPGCRTSANPARR